MHIIGNNPKLGISFVKILPRVRSEGVVQAGTRGEGDSCEGIYDDHVRVRDSCCCRQLSQYIVYGVFGRTAVAQPRRRR